MTPEEKARQDQRIDQEIKSLEAKLERAIYVRDGYSSMRNMEGYFKENPQLAKLGWIGTDGEREKRFQAACSRVRSIQKKIARANQYDLFKVAESTSIGDDR